MYWKAGVPITVKHHARECGSRKEASSFFTPFDTEKGNGSRYTSFIENMGSHIQTGVYVPS